MGRENGNDVHVGWSIDGRYMYMYSTCNAIVAIARVQWLMLAKRWTVLVGEREYQSGACMD